jgi:hypothetical protein
VNLRILQNKALWRIVAFAFCVLVFFFALHAKTAVYNGGAPVKVTPSTSSKLWLSGNKVEIRSADLSSGAMLFWMTVLCLFQLYLYRAAPKLQTAFLTPPPRTFPLQQLHLFLRPPPVQS